MPCSVYNEPDFHQRLGVDHANPLLGEGLDNPLAGGVKGFRVQLNSSYAYDQFAPGRKTVRRPSRGAGGPA